MAIVQARGSWTIQDELGTRAVVQVYFLVDDTATVATIDSDFYAWGQVIEQITEGEIVAATLSYYGNLAGLQTPPVTGSRVEATGVFNFTNTFNPRHFGVPIPALISAAIVAGKIDLTNSHVTALVNQVTNTNSTFTPADAHFISQFGGVLADAFLSFRKRRKQLLRSSYER